MMLDTTQSCTQNNTSKCAYQIRERCGLNLGTIWIKSGSCVSCSRYHVGCTQVPRGLYMGFIWVLCGFNLCPTWVPIISPYGTHTVPICNAYMGPSWENSYRAHMEDYVGPIWDPSGCAGWEVRAKIQRAIGPHEDFLTIVKRRKLQWFGHVSRSLGLVS